MSSRPEVGLGVSLSVLVLFGLAPGAGGPRLGAAAQPGPAAGAPVKPALAPPEVIKAVREIEEAFINDYNKADSKAIAAFFADDAEVIDPDGRHYVGREVIEQGFAETFAASKGAKIALEIFAVKSLAPDVIQEKGRSLVTPVQGAPLARLYTVLYVKRGGRWLVSSIRDDVDPAVSPHDRLKDLEWMVGDWVDEGEDSLVRLNCRWADDGNYLLRSFTVHHQGKQVLSVSQRIGWDSVARQFRSWEFDSDGGFGEGRWAREGERWVIKHTGVRPEGKPSSSTTVMTRVRADMVRWALSERVVGDEVIPNEIDYVLVRIPPPPSVKRGAAPATSPSTKARSVR